MDALMIAPTKETPAVRFDYAKRRLEMSGESYPENAMAFYAPIRADLDRFLNSGLAAEGIVVSFAMRYFNSSSTKILRMLVGLLDRAAHGGVPVTLYWLHDPEDDLMAEFGHDLREEFSGAQITVAATEDLAGFAA